MDAQLLRDLSFLEGLSDEQLAQLAQRCREEQYRPRQHIIGERQQADTWFCILSGWVQVTRETPNGTVLLGKLGPSRFFGERALLDGGPRTADVTTDSDCTFAVLSRADYLALAREAPEIGAYLREIATSQWRRYAPVVPA